MNIPSRYDYTGQKFWNLTAIKPIRVGGRHRGIVWLWKCDCGTEIERVAHDIKRGHQKSCGCLKIESTRQRASKPEGVAAFHLLYTSYKFKAEDRGYSFDLSKEEFRNITVQNCYYCGREPFQVMTRKGMNGKYVYSGVDRIDNNQGYSINNCVPCCGICNQMKMDLGYSEFLHHVGMIAQHRGIR